MNTIFMKNKTKQRATLLPTLPTSFTPAPRATAHPTGHSSPHGPRLTCAPMASLLREASVHL